jgi:hypothetical protein
MITFSKKSSFENTKLIMEIDDDEITIPELTREYLKFLSHCGFTLNGVTLHFDKKETRYIDTQEALILDAC